jgi:hypothetical protein
LRWPFPRCSVRRRAAALPELNASLVSPSAYSCWLVSGQATTGLALPPLKACERTPDLAVALHRGPYASNEVLRGVSIVRRYFLTRLSMMPVAPAPRCRAGLPNAPVSKEHRSRCGVWSAVHFLRSAASDIRRTKVAQPRAQPGRGFHAQSPRAYRCCSTATPPA